ncbi:MAG: hypothetical protein AB1941_19075 [Gemmatimonadota bacterium]
MSRRRRAALAGAVLAVAALALGIRALRGSALAGEGAPGVEDLPLLCVYGARDRVNRAVLEFAASLDPE